MSVKNFVQCGLVTPIAPNTVELVLVAPTASYQYPPLDGGTLVIADSVARPTFYEIISYTHRIDNVLYGVVRAKEGTTARAWTGTTWIYQALTAQDYVDALALKAPLASPALTGVPTAPTAPLGTNTQQIATMAAVQAAIANLVASSPAALDTLKELAAALGNDPNFATTINNALAGKEPSIAAGTSAQMWLGNKTWASVLTQVQNTLLTGLGAGSNATILTTDTLIGALAKIQNQLNNKANFTDSRLSDAREWTATEVTQAEAEAGSATVARKWTAMRVWQAVLASTLTGLNLTVGTAVAATDTVLVAIGKLQKQITDAGTNLASNVRATVLTGYLVGSNAALADTDTVLAAFGKIQGQLNGKLGSTATAAAATTLTGLTATVAELNYNDGVTSNIQTQLNAKAPLASPALTGTPTAPTAATATNTTQLATTAFVQANCALQLSLTGGTLSGNVTYNDSVQARFGSSADMVIYHNGTHSYIDQNVTGNLYIRNNVTGGTILFYADNSGGTSQVVAQLGVGADNAAYLYAGGATKLNTTAAGVTVTGALTATDNVTAYSDIRLKTDIEVIPDALGKVELLRGVTYTRKDSGEQHTGVIAQEVAAVLPEAVNTSGEYMSVAYGNMVGLLIEAIKELNHKVDRQAREIAELRAL